MPYNLAKLEQRLEDCNQKLDELFNSSQIEINGSIASQIKSVKKYYENSCNGAENKEQMEHIIENYELFVGNLEKIQETVAEHNKTHSICFQEYYEAINALKNINASHKVTAMFANLANACELIFWASALLTLFASIFAIALPVLVVQPAVGVVLSITTAGLILKAFQKLFDCLTAFKSYQPHEDEYYREKQIFTLFQPEQKKEHVPADSSEITDPEEPSGIFCY